MKEPLALTCKNIFVKQRLTFACAESLTGGALSASLTSIPGASEFFLGSVIAYSNHVKSKVLSIPQALIEKKGAVSKEVATQMALGVRQLIGADVSSALTGVAGPLGGTDEIPVGTYWACIVTKDITHSWIKKASGTREMVIESAVNDMLLTLCTLIG